MGSKQVQRDMGEPLLLTYAEAAAYIGVNLARVRRLLREGEIHNVPVGPRERRIRRSECDAWVDRLDAARGECGTCEGSPPAGFICSACGRAGSVAS